MSIADLITGAEFPHRDYIVLAGVKSPGRANVAGAGTPRNWDIRNGYGFSGAAVYYTGDNLAKFDVTIELWEKEHFAEWPRFAKLLEKAPLGKRPSAMDIEHPLLRLPPLQITSVVVEDASQFVQDDDGLWTMTIKFIQYRAPKPALSKPLASIPSATKPTPTAQTEAEREIQALSAQLSALTK